MKKLLVIAYHFPPAASSSGTQRTLCFVRHLRDMGWESTVLTVSAGAHQIIDDGQMSKIPPGMSVTRALTLDTARHGSLFGRYPRWLATPDRWASWLFSGYVAGRRLIRTEEPDAIFATFPIASALSLALKLEAFSGLPLIADFRDSMFDQSYPIDPRDRDVAEQLERQVINHCKRALFTTPMTRDLYLKRYPGVKAMIGRPARKYSYIFAGTW